MATEQHVVRVYYRLDSGSAERGAQTIAGRLNQVESASSSSAMALRGVGTGMVVGAAIAAVGALTTRTIELNARAESTALALAGMMHVGGLTGHGFKSFEASLMMSEQTMAQIRRDAAKLPGEAQDFITVFRGGLAGAIRAGMSDPAAIASFTNQFGAVAIALQVDSDQASRDLNLMLSGRAGAQVAMWNRLGDAIGKSAREFNALDPAERLRLLQGAIASYRPMIKAYEATWDAIASTASSNATELLRVGGRPLFEFAKRNLAAMNNLFSRNESALQRMASALSSGLVSVLEDATHEASSLLAAFDRWTGASGLMTIIDRLGAGVAGAAGTLRRGVGAMPGSTAMGGAIGLAAGGPIGALIGGTLGAFMTHTKAVSATLANLGSAVGSLLSLVGPLIGAFGVITAFLGGTLAGILPGLSSYLASFLGAVSFVAGGLISILTDLWTTVGPSIVALGSALGDFLSALGSVVGPVILWLGGHLLSLAQTLSTHLGPAVRWVANLLTSAFHWLATKLRALGVSMGGGAGASNPLASATTGDTISDRLRALLGRFSATGATSDAATPGAASGARARRPAQPARRGNTTINQHNHYTVNEARNPERLFVEIRRHARDALSAAQTETPLARVVRG